MINSEPKIAELLSSKGRIKILNYLLKVGEANITNIAKATRLHHSAVEKHLKKLISLGIVEEQRIGRLRLFRIVWLNPKVSILRELIESFEE